ncbi:MAG TPA: serine--tRNA ligase [Chitinophagaceae bacterium]|nr:serine--tRNA ligase [Chitinophagaceae bacterium]HNU14408.1 serine--tRNA ligase [Chitinophagaceae bacterium]
MLQLQMLRQNPEAVKERLAIKHFSETGLVDEILLLDEEIRQLKKRIEDAQMQINVKSAQIPQLMKGDKNDEAAKIRDEVILLKTVLNDDKPVLEQKTKAIEDALVKLPNLPSDKVPAGKTPADNVVVREGGNKPTLPAGSLPHWELIKKYDIVDFETGAKITGSGFPLYKGKGAKLQRALIQYFLDFNTAAGYTEYLPPLMVNADTAYGTGQLPDKEGQMYHMPADGFYMIPTSEVPVTNIYRNEIVKEADLPLKMTAYSPCFRREAGSFGADVRGLNRVHQFDKVEIVQLVHPATSYEVHQNMVNHVEKLLQSLELPYRILALCGGDMSFTSALTYDFEVYSAAQEKWLEVSSVSNFEAYQTNRMKIRFKDENGKMQLLHSLNGSSLALPRIVASLLENNQTAEGIKFPPVLHSYFGAGILN